MFPPHADAYEQPLLPLSSTGSDDPSTVGSSAPFLDRNPLVGRLVDDCLGVTRPWYLETARRVAIGVALVAPLYLTIHTKASDQSVPITSCSALEVNGTASAGGLHVPVAYCVQCNDDSTHIKLIVSSLAGLSFVAIGTALIGVFNFLIRRFEELSYRTLQLLPYGFQVSSKHQLKKQLAAVALVFALLLAYSITLVVYQHMADTKLPVCTINSTQYLLRATWARDDQASSSVPALQAVLEVVPFIVSFGAVLSFLLGTAMDPYRRISFKHLLKTPGGARALSDTVRLRVDATLLGGAIGLAYTDLRDAGLLLPGQTGCRGRMRFNMLRLPKDLSADQRRVQMRAVVQRVTAVSSALNNDYWDEDS